MDDSPRLRALGRWLWHRYVESVVAANPAGAVKYAEGLFYMRFNCDRAKMIAEWDEFETELFRLANSEAATADNTHLIVLGF